MDLYKAVATKNYSALKEHLEAAFYEAASHQTETLKESLVKLTNRVRGGKVQRNVKVVGDENYKLVDGKAVRKSAQETRNRQLAQNKAALKRAAKNARAALKRRMSLAKRAAVGL